MSPVSSTVGGPQLTLTPDPIAAIIVKVENEFEAGQRELAAGRLVAARQRFDSAVDIMLALPEGARTRAKARG